MIWERHGSIDDLRPQIALDFWGTFALGFGSALLLPGPVVLGHAFFFRMESRLLGPLPARTVTRAAQILSGLAVTAIVIQAGGLFSGWAYLLAGFTAPGYFLAAVGFRRAWREVSSFTGISTDVARRSPGL